MANNKREVQEGCVGFGGEARRSEGVNAKSQKCKAGPGGGRAVRPIWAPKTRPPPPGRAAQIRGHQA
uniref:Uncharacterized protein n=1 Tax=Oryza glumipatula TaxID=40148 RepID=A0A0D9ZKQ2_9ORYZ